VHADWIVPRWPAPPRVRALSTTRAGGSSGGPYAGFNFGDHVGDAPAAVAANRGELARLLPAAPVWLRQVHGTRVVDAAQAEPGCAADAALARQAACVCVVMTADCLPVLLCDRAGSVVAAAHAGWRGLAAGVLERSVEAMAVAPADLLAWLGPAIGPAHFEVGAEVRAAFVDADPTAASAFRAGAAGKWHADLFVLARQRLQACGVASVHGGGECTYSDPQRFYSHRRDGLSGRMATLIWLA
jgi:YfiH family protein